MSLESKLDCMDAAKVLSQYFKPSRFSGLSTALQAIAHPIEIAKLLYMSSVYYLNKTPEDKLEEQEEELVFSRRRIESSQRYKELGLHTKQEQYAYRFALSVKMHLYSVELRQHEKTPYYPIMARKSFEEMLGRIIPDAIESMQTMIIEEGNGYFDVNRNLGNYAHKWLCSELYSKLESGNTVIFLNEIKVSPKGSDLIVERIPRPKESWATTPARAKVELFPKLGQK